MRPTKQMAHKKLGEDTKALTKSDGETWRGSHTGYQKRLRSTQKTYISSARQWGTYKKSPRNNATMGNLGRGNLPSITGKRITRNTIRYRNRMGWNPEENTTKKPTIPATPRDIKDKQKATPEIIVRQNLHRVRQNAPLHQTIMIHPQIHQMHQNPYAENEAQ